MVFAASSASSPVFSADADRNRLLDRCLQQRVATAALLRIGPSGPRVSAVMPATGASMANFSQSVREMLSEAWR